MYILFVLISNEFEPPPGWNITSYNLEQFFLLCSCIFIFSLAGGLVNLSLAMSLYLVGRKANCGVSGEIWVRSECNIRRVESKNTNVRTLQLSLLTTTNPKHTQFYHCTEKPGCFHRQTSKIDLLNKKIAEDKSGFIWAARTCPASVWRKKLKSLISGNMNERQYCWDLLSFCILKWDPLLLSN